VNAQIDRLEAELKRLSVKEGQIVAFLSEQAKARIKQNIKPS